VATALCLLEGSAGFQLGVAPTATAMPLHASKHNVRTPSSPLLAEESAGPLAGLFGGGSKKAGDESEEDKMTLDKVASFGIAGVLSIAVAETVFWVLSFPTSELLYFVSTGEWIDLLTQEGQIKFLAFTAGWGALGGVVAQYRTVLTAAAMTPWMDRNVVKPYINPVMENFGSKGSDGP